MAHHGARRFLPDEGLDQDFGQLERPAVPPNAPTPKSAPDKAPLAFVKEPLQRFPTRGPPTPPLAGLKKQIARGDAAKLQSGSLARLEAEHHQKLAAASATTTTPRAPSNFRKRDAPEGASDASETAAALSHKNSNKASREIVRSGLIEGEEKYGMSKSARTSDSGATPLPPPHSPGVSRSPASRREKEVRKALALATSDEEMTSHRIAPSQSKASSRTSSKASTNSEPVSDCTNCSDDRDVKIKASSANMSKEGPLTAEIHHLKERRVNSLKKALTIDETTTEGHRNQDDEELIAKPGAYRIGENVEQEDEADLEEWRATRRLANGRHLGREAREHLYSSTDALEASRSSLTASRSSNDHLTLAPVTPVSDPGDEKAQRCPPRRWAWALAIALVLATVAGAAVGVSASSSSNNNNNSETSTTAAIAAPSSAPSGAPSTLTPTSLPTLSVVPTISGSAWTKVGAGSAGQDGVGVGVDVSLSGDGSTVAVSSLANADGRIGSIVSIATVGPGEWTRVAPDLLLEARATIDLSQDGTRLLVGIPSAQEGQLGRAAAYSWDGNSFIQIGQNLTQTSSVADESYAKAVCISDDGSRIAIADPSMASVYIYDLVGDSWVIIKVITGHDAHAIALSGDGSTIAVSSTAPSGESFFSDIFVYALVDGERWAMVGQSLYATDALDYERSSPLALSQNGSVLVAGASLFGEETDGMVQVFHLDTASEPVTWKRKGSPILGTQLDSLGWSVDVSADGSVVAAGSPRFDGVVPGCTSAYQLHNGNWRLVGNAIESEEFEEQGLSGFAVSLDGGGRLLAIGAPHAGNDRGELRAGLALAFELL